MLDGKCYYAAFLNENPDIRLRMRTLADVLKKLEKEFRQHIEQVKAWPDTHDMSKIQEP